MPVRSLNSSVFKWPDAQTIDQAVRHWAAEVGRERKDVLHIGYFGSYARGDWGVGSDLDLIIIVERAAQPFERRSAEWETTKLPVPTDLFVYTQDEWWSLSPHSRFHQTLMREVVWVYGKKNL